MPLHLPLINASNCTPCRCLAAAMTSMSPTPSHGRNVVAMITFIYNANDMSLSPPPPQRRIPHHHHKRRINHTAPNFRAVHAGANAEHHSTDVRARNPRPSIGKKVPRTVVNQKDTLSLCAPTLMIVFANTRSSWLRCSRQHQRRIASSTGRCHARGHNCDTRPCRKAGAKEDPASL